MVNPVYEIEYTDQEVTAWGGMRLMKEVLERSGVSRQLEELPLPQPGSNRGYAAREIVESLMVSIWMGASRLSHTEVLRHDRTLKKLFGWEQTPSGTTYGRFLNKFSQGLNQAVFPRMQQEFISQLPLKKMTLDIDSSVITRYGQQEGVARGYNPQKPGRGSHHPLMALIAETRMVANAWMRPGNTGASSHAQAFLDETFEIMSPERIGLIRADSGFCSQKMMDYFEGKGINYIVAARFHSGIKHTLIKPRWTKLKDGVEVFELSHACSLKAQPRRLVVVRKDIGRLPKATGRQLEIWNDFQEDSRYRYSAYYTNLDLPIESVWLLYRDRGDAENRIKELKYDFGLEGFNLKSFWATEAAFRFIVMAYNLMSLFRQLVLKNKNHNTLSTLRFKCFALGAWITRHARKSQLKISLPSQKHSWLDGLFSRADQLSPPFNFP